MSNKIFVVEDDEIIVELLQTYIENMGYEFAGSSDNGEEALILMKNFPSDLVLMDVYLNGPMDGIETAAKLRADSGTAVIYLTSSADDETLARAKLTEPFGYLLKPINTKELKASIEMGLYKIDMERRQQRIFEAVVHTITEMVKLHDPYLNDVQLRAAQLSVAIATELNLPGQEVRGIQIAAMLHGIGLVALPAYLLSNRTELQGAKKLYYQTHTEIAWNLLKNIEFPYPVAEMVYQHMERLDGSGYPRGLSDDAILPGARVVAVACQTAKMLTSHGIEPAASLDTTLSELESGSGTLYDPLAVEACCRLFREKHFAFKD